MIEPLALALQAAIAAQNVTCYLDQVPANPPYPYVALFVDAGRRSDESLGGLMERAEMYPQMTCVGITAAQLRALRDRAMLVVGKEITGGGYMARIGHAASSKPSRDDDIPDRIVLTATETLHLTALPL